MSQTIHCRACNADTEAESIADLIRAHTDDTGRFACARCGGTDTFMQQTRHPRLEGRGERWIRGIVPIETKNPEPTYLPFVFLTADAADGDVTGIEFKYYRSGRTADGGRPRERRPGGGPALTQGQLLSLVQQLVAIGVVSAADWHEFGRAVPGARVAHR
jgi:hypothetical protein